MTNDLRRDEEEDCGPGAAYQAFVLMESLMLKLNMLNYEEAVLARHNMKNLSRHYFVSSPYLPSNPHEQFFVFTITAAWLINMAGRPFTEPQECDEPNATLSNILAELEAFGVKVDFPPSKLKSGSGENVCFVLDQLADEALRRSSHFFRRPIYPTETTEVMMEDAAKEQIEESEDDEDVMDLEALRLRTTHTEAEASSKPYDILKSAVDVAKWKLEVERLKTTIRTDHKDWRIHLDQMHKYNDGIKTALKKDKSYLDELQDNIHNTLRKVTSREKYINDRLEHLTQKYRSTRAELSDAKSRYQQACGAVMERTIVLADISQELEKVKQEMEEKGKSISDGAPLVKMKQSLIKLKQENAQMDVRIDIVEHLLLQAKLKEKSNMIWDMDATVKGKF